STRATVNSTTRAGRRRVSRRPPRAASPRAPRSCIGSAWLQHQLCRADDRERRPLSVRSTRMMLRIFGVSVLVAVLGLAAGALYGGATALALTAVLVVL